MKAPGADDIEMAHACLKMWRHGGPYSPAAKKSLKGLVKALDNLDPAARALLSTVGVSVKKTRGQVETCLKSFKPHLKQDRDDILYRMAVQYLARAYGLKFGRSPLTDGHLEKFQEFADREMKDYGARRPTENYVRDARAWLRRKALALL